VDEAEVTWHLYGLALGDFTRARNEAAAQARASGNRELAEHLRKLRKPTVSAWTLNMLVRRYPDEIGQLMSIGAQLRAAQTALEGDAIRELSRQRRQVVAALARRARVLAAELGQRISDAAELEIEDTLQAALVDPAAGYAVRSGQLTAPLSYAGLGPLSAAAAAAGAARVPEPAAPPEPEQRPALRAAEPEGWGGLIWPVPDEIEPVPEPVDDDAAREIEAARLRAQAEARRRRDELEQARRRRELEAARDARQEAEKAAADAAAALRDAQARLEQVTEQRAELDRRVDELHERLRLAEEEAMRVAKEVLEARHDRDAAARADLLARRTAERARFDVERLDH
jgi:hypothetical protein